MTYHALCIWTCTHVPLKTNSNDFRSFLELISRFEFEFRRSRKLLFFERFEFLVCSKFNHTHHVAVHVHVLWPVCTHTIPIPKLWVSVTIHVVKLKIFNYWNMYKRCSKKKWNHCGRSWTSSRAQTRTVSYTYTYAHIHIHIHIYIFILVEEEEEGGDKPNHVTLLSVPRIAETEQLLQAQRMIGGIGNLLLSTYSQTESGEGPLFSFGEPLNHVIPIRGQILVSRTNDDPLLPVCMYKTPSVCTFKTSLCVPAPRAHVSTHVRVVPAYTGTFWMHTRRRFWTHTRVFPRFFSACRNTQTHTRTHTHTHQQQHHNTQHHDHNDTHHTIQHTTTHGDREKETERDRERETRQDKRRRYKTRRQEKMKEKIQDKTVEDRKKRSFKTRIREETGWKRREKMKEKRRDRMKKKREDERKNEER